MTPRGLQRLGIRKMRDAAPVTADSLGLRGLWRSSSASPCQGNITWGRWHRQGVQVGLECLHDSTSPVYSVSRQANTQAETAATRYHWHHLNTSSGTAAEPGWAPCGKRRLPSAGPRRPGPRLLRGPRPRPAPPFAAWGGRAISPPPGGAARELPMPRNLPCARGLRWWGTGTKGSSAKNLGSATWEGSYRGGGTALCSRVISRGEESFLPCPSGWGRDTGLPPASRAARTDCAGHSRGAPLLSCKSPELRWKGDSKQNQETAQLGLPTTALLAVAWNCSIYPQLKNYTKVSFVGQMHSQIVPVIPPRQTLSICIYT